MRAWLARIALGLGVLIGMYVTFATVIYLVWPAMLSLMMAIGCLVTLVVWRR